MCMYVYVCVCMRGNFKSWILLKTKKAQVVWSPSTHSVNKVLGFGSSARVHGNER